VTTPVVVYLAQRTLTPRASTLDAPSGAWGDVRVPPLPVVPWTWRRVLRDQGPPERDFLAAMLVLNTYMNREGFTSVSQRTLAHAARMDPKTLRKHLRRAEREGWLGIEKRRGGGQAWAGSLYRATCPNSIGLPEKDTALADSIRAEFAPVENEGEGTSVPHVDKGEGVRIPSRSRAKTLEGGEGAGNGHVNVRETTTEGEGNIAKVGEHGFPTNSHPRSYISPVREEGAPPHPGRFGVKKRGQKPKEEERKEKILALPNEAPADVAKLLHASGVTVEEVLRVREVADGADASPELVSRHA